jgi:hypothetical protein
MTSFSSSSLITIARYDTVDRVIDQYLTVISNPELIWRSGSRPDAKPVHIFLQRQMQPPFPLELIVPTVVARFILDERLASMKKTVALPGDAIYLIIQNLFRALAALGATKFETRVASICSRLAD